MISLDRTFSNILSTFGLSTPSAAPARKSNTAVAVPPAKQWTPPMRGEWTLNGSGGLSDPVNLYVHGSLDDIKKAFAKSGWSVADPRDTENDLKFVGSAAGYEVAGGILGLWNSITGDNATNPFSGDVNQEPVSTLTYNGKPQDIAFEKNNDPLGGRHHFRVYDTGKVDAQGKEVWAVAASQDIGIKFDPSKPDQGFMNHYVDPNADHERDTVLRDLRSTGMVQSVGVDTLPWQSRTPDQLHSVDGKVYEVSL